MSVRRKTKCCLIPDYFSYLYPDGRSINPDLSWAVQATPEDHVKVRNEISIIEKLVLLALSRHHSSFSLLSISNYETIMRKR